MERTKVHRRKLHRRAGNKIKQYGTDSVIHFSPISNDELVEGMEWNELIQFRRLRAALASNEIEKLTIDTDSVYFWLATALSDIVQQGSGNKVVVLHDSTRFAPVIEAMMAIADVGKSRFVHHVCYGVPHHCLPVLTSFHKQGGKLSSAQYIAKITSEPISRDGVASIKAGYDRTIIFSDRFHHEPNALSETMKLVADLEDLGVDDMVFVGLLATDSPKVVTDVFGREGEPATKKQIAVAALHAGCTTFALPLRDFDRGFFIPPNDGVEWCLLHFTRITENNLTRLGFRSLVEEEEPVSQLLPIVVDKAQGNHSYYNSLATLETSELGEDQIDWHAWAVERNWDPAAVDWQSGSWRGDINMLGFVWGKRASEATWLKVKIHLEKNANQKQFTPYIGAYTFIKSIKEYREISEFVFVFFIFEFFKNGFHINILLSVLREQLPQLFASKHDFSMPLRASISLQDLPNFVARLRPKLSAHRLAEAWRQLEPVYAGN